MKTAYIFHGHSRTWKLCYDNFFNNVFSELPGDIFIHTWDTVNTSCGSYWNGWVDLSGEQLRISQQTPDIGGIYETYKPKILLVEKDQQPDISNCKDINNMTKGSLGTKNMLRGSRKIFEIAEKYDNYDIFFSTRLDINYTTKLKLEEITSSEMLAPHTHNFISDIWMIGNKEHMDIKTKYVDHIDNYWFSKDSFTSIWYEDAFTRYMNDMHVTCKQPSITFNTPRIF
jgi:hypothetical protein